MRLLLWNIKHGGQDRTILIGEETLKYNPDIIVLTEFRDDKNGQTLLKTFYEHNYIYQAFNKSLKELKIRRNKSRDLNSVMVCSKIPFHNSKVISIPLNEERVIKVEMNNLCLYSMYFPQKNEKKQLFEFILNTIATNENTSNKPVMFLGDFNTGNNELDRESSKSSKFYCENHFNLIQKNGFKDIWRYFNNNSKEYTWYSNSGNGFRIDHAFIDNQYISLIKNCYYIHEPREIGLSDHSIMNIEL